MFHRVKSESQETTAQPQPMRNDNNKPEIQAEEAEENEAVAEAQAEAEEQEETSYEEEQESTESENQTTSEAEEDNEDMSDNSQQDTQPQYQSAPSAAAPYQRPGQPGVLGRSAPGGYPGSSPYYAAQPDASSATERRLTIGAGITMSGEIESCDYLLVEGTVEAALKGAKVLDIAERGVFYGTVEIGDANIAGRFEGDITAHGRLTISATGTVTGSIAYKELEIEAGAVIDGKLTPISAQGTAAAKKPEAPKAAKKAAPAKKPEAPQEPANNDGELFSKAATAAE